MGPPCCRFTFTSAAHFFDFEKAKPLDPNPPPKAHSKVITWTEHHPSDSNEMITSSADGTAKVWRNPAQD